MTRSFLQCPLIPNFTRYRTQYEVLRPRTATPGARNSKIGMSVAHSLVAFHTHYWSAVESHDPTTLHRLRSYSQTLLFHSYGQIVTNISLCSDHNGVLSNPNDTGMRARSHFLLDFQYLTWHSIRVERPRFFHGFPLGEMDLRYNSDSEHGQHMSFPSSTPRTKIVDGSSISITSD